MINFQNIWICWKKKFLTLKKVLAINEISFENSEQYFISLFIKQQKNANATKKDEKQVYKPAF